MATSPPGWQGFCGSIKGPSHFQRNPKVAALKMLIFAKVAAPAMIGNDSHTVPQKRGINAAGLPDCNGDLMGAAGGGFTINNEKKP
jgi:hypothetical protein